MAGDVLFNEGGDRDKLGRGWIWRGQLPECIHQNHVFRARLRTPDVFPEYLSWYGNSGGQKYFFEQGKQTTNLASINLTKLKRLPVPLPPLMEQKRIVAEVQRCSQLLAKPHNRWKPDFSAAHVFASRSSNGPSRGSSSTRTRTTSPRPCSWSASWQSVLRKTKHG